MILEAALRASLGHPEPFNVQYIEIGNEVCLLVLHSGSALIATRGLPFECARFVRELSLGSVRECNPCRVPAHQNHVDGPVRGPVGPRAQVR